MNRVLLLENINVKVKKKFVEVGYNVDSTHSMSEEHLLDIIKNYTIIGIRSKTKLNKKILEHATNLKVIGCFCIGTDQVDLETASQKGITVFNSPYMNTRSVAEIIIANIINLSRKVTMRNMEMHDGIWNKTSYQCNEIRGKKIGIIGYGHVGSQVAILSEALGMEVYFYDINNIMPLGNSTKIDSLPEILHLVDYITLHVPLTEETSNMITSRELKLMKNTAYLLNFSRGTVVNIDDLKTALQNKQIAGCAIDVFPIEPNTQEEFHSRLRGMDNVILSPHIGGSTYEAQTNIAEDVGCKIINFMKSGTTKTCVNYPAIKSSKQDNRNISVFNIHYNRPGSMAKINNIISSYGLNVTNSVLSTDSSYGLCIISFGDVDTEGKVINEIIEKIQEISIETRRI